jgi:glycosyltransferase involved in cell wall biosynthesis
MLRNDFDVINAHFMGFMASISSYAIIRKKMKNIPVVHNVMGLYHDPYIVDNIDDPLSHRIEYGGMQSSFPINPLRLKNWFSHLPLFNSEIVGALTKWEMEEIKKFGLPDDRLRIMPIGVDLKIFKKKEKGFKERYNVNGEMILFVGQPIPRKGPEYLIKAMKNIIHKFPDCKCIFIGYKSNKDIEELCRTFGIDKNIIFIGFLNEEEKIDAYKSADVFVLPTLYEGFGIVFVEAMASGCPIVTTNVAGIPELVEDGKNGFLVNPKNIGELEKSIERILTDKNLRTKFSSNNIKKSRFYNWDNLIDIYEKCFEDAITSSLRCRILKPQKANKIFL